jgi:hypothetical protein
MRGRPPPWPYGPSCSHAAPTGASAGENSLARVWHGYLIVAAVRPPCSGGPYRVFLHTGWSATRLAGGGRTVFSSAQAAPAVFGTAPARRRGPVRAPGLTCGFWWQVQDSNLGRPSSAILQTVAGIPLNWANIRVIRDFGTHLTCSRPSTRALPATITGQHAVFRAEQGAGRSAWPSQNGTRTAPATSHGHPRGQCMIKFSSILTGRFQARAVTGCLVPTPC